MYLAVLLCLLLPPSNINELHIALQVRREKINERMRCLQDLVPGCYKVLSEDKPSPYDSVYIYYNAVFF